MSWTWKWISKQRRLCSPPKGGDCVEHFNWLSDLRLPVWRVSFGSRDLALNPVLQLAGMWINLLKGRHIFSKEARNGNPQPHSSPRFCLPSAPRPLVEASSSVKAAFDTPILRKGIGWLLPRILILWGVGSLSLPYTLTLLLFITCPTLRDWADSLLHLV